MRNKKGALELSMTTIIVIVLGVTLLILGLAFIRGLFGRVSVLTDEAFRIAEQEIQGKMGPSDKFYVSGLRFEAEAGKSTPINLGVQNLGDEENVATFSLEVVPGPQGGSADWFTLPPETELEPGEKKGLPAEVVLPKGTLPGKSFSFTLRVLRNSESYASQAIIVKAKEE